MVRSNSWAKNCDKLRRIHDRMMAWASDNQVEFGPEKYVLMHFCHVDDEEEDAQRHIPAISGLPSREDLFSKPCLRILGVLFDSRLTWAWHVHDVATRADRRMRQLQSISGTTWGPDLHQMRQLYVSQVQSILSYASPAWFFKGYQGTSVMSQGAISAKLIKLLDTRQGQYLEVISGALHHTCRQCVRKELWMPLLSASMDVRTVAHHAKMMETEQMHMMLGNARSTLGRKGMSSLPLSITHLRAQNLIEGAKSNTNILSYKENRKACIDSRAKKLLHEWCNRKWEVHKAETSPVRMAEKPTFSKNWGPSNLRGYQDLNRKQCTILLHSRIGSIGLNAYLQSKHLADSPNCPRCFDYPHTVKHLFSQCRALTKQREKLLDALAQDSVFIDVNEVLYKTPALAADYALDNFGIAQFTGAPFTPSNKRARGPENDAGTSQPPTKKARKAGKQGQTKTKSESKAKPPQLKPFRRYPRLFKK
ncbi:hypothetical protein F4778DRAFT_766681 [Xylariomycetidae sp. FL2044]|nr:hypothetical protein F4778DRAFT_766681 [Xylariomycetidae sp. FL2044]